MKYLILLIFFLYASCNVSAQVPDKNVRDLAYYNFQKIIDSIPVTNISYYKGRYHCFEFTVYNEKIQSLNLYTFSENGNTDTILLGKDDFKKFESFISDQIINTTHKSCNSFNKSTIIQPILIINVPEEKIGKKMEDEVIEWPIVKGYLDFLAKTITLKCNILLLKDFIVHKLPPEVN